jgi:hypothetical protein
MSRKGKRSRVRSYVCKAKINTALSVIVRKDFSLLAFERLVPNSIQTMPIWRHADWSSACRYFENLSGAKGAFLVCILYKRFFFDDVCFLGGWTHKEKVGTTRNQGLRLRWTS